VIELWPATNVFRKGFHIRVSICGSDFFPILRSSASKTGQGTQGNWIDGNVMDYMLTNKNQAHSVRRSPGATPFPSGKKGFMTAIFLMAWKKLIIKRLRNLTFINERS
jgi:hypothetical protein